MPQGRPWTMRDQNKLARLYAERRPMPDIAEELDRPITACYRRVSELRSQGHVINRFANEKWPE